MEMLIAMTVAMISLIVFLILYIAGKDKYKDYIEPLDKEEFGLKAFFHVGFMMLDIIHYKYNSSLDRQNRKYLKELYEPEYSEFYLRVYWAQGLTFGVLLFVLGALMAAGLSNLTLGLGFGTFLAVLLPYASLKDIEKKVTERHNSIAMDLPELVNKIVILTGAGLTLQAALLKISNEMSGDRVLYKELANAMQKIKSGETAEKALDYMGVKCNTIEMRRFVSIIVQNINRGGSDVSSALKSIGDELWAGRKAAALRVAEEASTKMLFPMMLMLFAVMIMVIFPAVQNFM